MKKAGNKKKSKKVEKSHKYRSEEFEAICDFGLRLENGEPGLIEQGTVLKVLAVKQDKVKLEKIGWVLNRSAVFKFLKKVEYHQYSLDEVIGGK